MSDYKFKKIIYSGICLCGHDQHEHHGGMILNEEAYKIMGPRLPQECEYFGCNEDGGFDELGEDHCSSYVDKDNPDEELKKSWQGTKR